MNNVAVFGVGLMVTLLVAAAMALLIFGAVIDGREDEERRAENEHADVEVGTEAPAARPSAAGYRFGEPGTVVP